MNKLNHTESDNKKLMLVTWFILAVAAALFVPQIIKALI